MRRASILIVTLAATAWASAAAVEPTDTPSPGAATGVPANGAAGPLPTVPGWNADYLDGLDATAFAAVDHDHDDRYPTQADNDARYLAKTGKATDADHLDGHDSSAFARTGHDHDDRYPTQADNDARYLAKTGKTADADHLDGHDSSAFARTGHDHDGTYLRTDRSGTVAGDLTVTGKVNFDGQKVCRVFRTSGGGPAQAVTLVVPGGWTTGTCNALAAEMAGTSSGIYRLGCIFATGFAFGDDSSAGFPPGTNALPSPNCGW